MTLIDEVVQVMTVVPELLVIPAVGAVVLVPTTAEADELHPLEEVPVTV